MPFHPQNTSFLQKIGLVLLGIVLGFLLLETGLRVGGGILTFIQEYQNRTAAQKQGVFRIMCIGESTTGIGGDNSYPRQLERILNEKDIGIDFSVINKGIPGKQTSVILEELDKNLNKYAPDMVIAMMGINDGRTDVEIIINPNGSTIFNFIRKSRIYKLINLLWLHITYRGENGEIRRGKNHYPVQVKFDSKRIGNERKYQKRTDVRFDLLRRLSDPRRYQETKEILQNMLESDPNNDQTYFELGFTYEWNGMDIEAANMYRKAVGINWRNSLAQYSLGRLLAERKEFDEAEYRIRKAIKIDPAFVEAYPELGYVYFAKKEYKKAHEIVSKGLEIDPYDDRALGMIEIINEAMGERKSLTEYHENNKVIRGNFFSAMTYNSYRKLIKILAKKEIQLVAVQYPVRDLDSLKMILEPSKGIILVDNEMVFKDAIKKASYDVYFTDLFAGNFGHGTKKGNRLLASNIARVILREYFGYDAYGELDPELSKEAELEARVRDLERQLDKVMLENEFLKKAVRNSLKQAEKKQSSLPKTAPSSKVLKGGAN